MTTEKKDPEEVDPQLEETPEETPEETLEETPGEDPEDPPGEPGETPEPDEVKKKFFERVQQSFPGQEFTSETEMMEATISHLNDLEIYVKENDEANQRVVEVLNEQPEIGEIIRDMSKGATFEEALVRHVDIEALKPSEDDPDHEKWEAQKKERKQRIKAAKEFELMLSQNRKASAKNLEKFQGEKQLTRDELNQFAGAVAESLKDVMDGHITPKLLDLMWKGLKYEEAVLENRKQGEIKGRNLKIEELKGKKDDKGDGVPHVASQGQPEPPKYNPVAKGIVDYMAKRQKF